MQTSKSLIPGPRIEDGGLLSLGRLGFVDMLSCFAGLIQWRFCRCSISVARISNHLSVVRRELASGKRCHAKCEPFSLPTVECWDGHIRIHEQERTWTYFLQRSRVPPITMLQERLMAQDRVGFLASMWEVSSVEKTCELRKRQRPFQLIIR
ncbi:hypothetical protein PoB_003695600 [Plakobranchus ocellatus]|uniref:Uncharacterized protein n=1 Tax=Plakobranchus ocellatus TaxID=259542 RepID=A0AAV4AH00_9GAST|nr:hypothetical protein PoB_003695600 [Plakobranchus ocellatus]